MNKYLATVRANLLQRLQYRPWWFWQAVVATILLLYYLLIMLGLHSFIANTTDAVQQQKSAIIWVTKVAPEILRLRRTKPHMRQTISGSPFNLINQEINELGWNNIVVSLQQLDANRVQIVFNNINFNQLIEWIEKLYAHTGIIVTDATIHKTPQPSIVQASLILQNSS